MTRPSNETQRAALKTATRQSYRRLGKLEAVADITRISVSRLSSAGNPQEDYFIPIDALLDIELDIGSPVVTEMMARLQGYVLVRAEEGALDPDRLDLLFETAVATRSVGEWSDAVIRALSDDHLSESELDELQDKATAMVERWERRLKALAILQKQRRAGS